MMRLLTLLLCAAFGAGAHAQNTLLEFDNTDFQVTTAFSDVGIFAFSIEIVGSLAPGLYSDPPLVEVEYSVDGTLVAGTPSGFPSFALQRTITGADFYAQGSSLTFEIAPNAVLTDGIQVAELVGNDVVFTFNGREVDNGRFHPALFELRADGTGRIQNSDNVPTLNPLNEVMFGAEYITDLMFDPGNTTLLTDIVPPAPPTPPVSSGGGGGAVSLWALAALLARRKNSA